VQAALPLFIAIVCLASSDDSGVTGAPYGSWKWTSRLEDWRLSSCGGYTDSVCAYTSEVSLSRSMDSPRALLLLCSAKWQLRCHSDLGRNKSNAFLSSGKRDQTLRGTVSRPNRFEVIVPEPPSLRGL
jgi:hypothetical protein